MVRGTGIWGAVGVVLGFGVILGAGVAPTWPVLAGVGLGVAGAALMMREAMARQAAMERAQVLEAMLSRDERALRAVDALGRTLVANAEGRRLLSGPDPLRTLEVRLFDSEADREAMARLRGALGAGLDASADVALKGEGDSGGQDWMQIAVSTLPRQDGARLVAAADVSARHAVEDILKSERESLSDFLDFLPAGVYAADSEQKFRYVNQTLAEWLGETADALIGRPVTDILAVGSAMPPADGVWRGEIGFRSARGDTFRVLALLSLYDEAGETLTRAVLVRDAEGADAATPSPAGGGAFSRLVFDEAPVGIAVADVAGLPYPMIAEANETLAGLLARGRDDLVGMRLSELAEPRTRPEVAALIERAARGEPVPPFEARLDCPGRELAAMIHLRDLYDEPVLPGVQTPPGRILVHVVDISDRRALQLQTAQAQKMQAMGQLAGGVAHDFNNLLTAMIGFCDLLLQRHGPGSASFTDIMQIKQNANRAANLVRQLLAFSRRQPLLPRFVSVPDALAELSHLLRRLLGETIELKLIHGRDVGYVRVDPGQFDQVIINLAVNARDAMPGGGSLTIRTEVAKVETEIEDGAETVAPGSYVRIEVADTGTGISEEDLPRIFEPFFSTKAGSAAGGTGLGLSTVYGIVRQMEGSVTVTSRRGQGATFTLLLPRFDEIAVHARGVRPPAEDPPPPESGAAPFLPESKVVLIVEDEDAVRTFGSRALAAKGYTVLEAADGEDAIHLLKDRTDVDVLITDMVMPGMDGATLARLVRQEHPQIRVILMSGYSEEVASDDLADAPDVHFLAKPFSLDALAAKVAEALEPSA